MTSTASAAEKIAHELILIGKAAPTFRAEQLGSSAKAIRPFVESGEIAELDAHDNLLQAAVRAGIPGKDASDVIEWAWFGDAPVPPEPEGFADVAAKLDAGFDPGRTVEFPTALVCAASGLDRLVEHLRSIDDRRSGPVVPDRWTLAVGSLSLVADHLGGLVKAIGLRRPDDHLADGVALAVAQVVQVAADLELDLGAAIARTIPAAKTA